MKKALSAVFALLFLASVAVNAQDDGPKLAKSAGKALANYNIDPTGNAGKLDDAKDKIDRALATPEAAALGSAWQIKGEVYATFNSKENAKRSLNKDLPLTANYALEAFYAFKKAHEFGVKKYEKADAIKGIADNLQASLVNNGAIFYEKQQFEPAFLSFKGSLESHDMLKAAGEKSIFDEAGKLDDQIYFTAITAVLAKKFDLAVPYLESLYKTGNAKSEIYETLYTCYNETGKTAEAEKLLTEGRAKYPDDAGLLFSEINIYLKKGKLAELTDRLKQAIAKEPNNVGLYVTLGSVYDNLYQKALESKDEAATNKNFEEAKKYYSEAISKDPKNVDATYSMGALYYNKAAILTKELNALPADAPASKYESYDKQIKSLFDSSLPFFQKAESFDPNDTNTLIALKEIYTRQEDDLALEFKKRLDNVVAGTKNAAPYFKN